MIIILTGISLLILGVFVARDIFWKCGAVLTLIGIVGVISFICSGGAFY